MAELFSSSWSIQFIIRIINVFLCDVSLTCPYAPMELAEGRNETGSKSKMVTTCGYTQDTNRTKRKQWWPGRRSIEAMEEGEKKGKRKQNGSQEFMKVMQAVFWLVTCPAKNKHHQRHLEWCQWPWAQSSGKNSSVKNVWSQGWMTWL